MNKSCSRLRSGKVTASRMAGHIGIIFSPSRFGLRGPSKGRNTELGAAFKPQGNAAQPWHQVNASVQRRDRRTSNPRRT